MLRKKIVFSCQNYFTGINDGTMIAFYAYMTANMATLSRQHTLIFSTVTSNLGSAYNKHDGIFTTPSDGYYIFTWTIVSGHHSYTCTEIVMNSSPMGSIVSDSNSVNEHH